MRNPGKPLRDHGGEMRSLHGPSDEAIEALLDGTPSQELAGTPLADLVERIRLDAATTEPTASPELASLMVHGLAPTEMGDVPATAGGSATAPTSASWLPQWTRRKRMIIEGFIAKVAALGLVAKATAAGAAVVVTAAGVGAVVDLPAPTAPSSSVTSELGDESDPEPQDGDVVTDDVLDGSEEVVSGQGEGCEPYGDGTGYKNFGDRVSQDATGACDGVAGVNGDQISAEAKARADARAEARDKERADAARARGAEGPEEGVEPGDEPEAGIENAPEDVVPDDAGDGSDDAAETEDEGTESDAPDDAPQVETPADGDS